MIPGPGIAKAVAHQANHLPISEVFGPTIQGEGPHTGRRCFFVRTGECNLHCNWCDTPYTWDNTRYDVKAECPPMSIPTILGHLEERGARPDDVVVLSGGEPLIHHHKVRLLVEAATGFSWHVESNGTIRPPSWWAGAIAHTTLSPKVAQSDDPEKRRLPRRSLAAWAELGADTGSVAWKFVCRHWGDLEAAQGIARDLDLDPRSVWIMPEGTDVPTILGVQRHLAPAVIGAGFNLTTRLHTLLWHDERGH